MSFRFYISPMLNGGNSLTRLFQWAVFTNWRERLLLAGLLLLAAWIFITGITWGLPSHKVDAFLFGHKTVWSGKKILELAGDRSYDPTRGADVDINPLTNRERTTYLNETDQQRAEIILRYRLFTYQPDEMISMMSLASMDPGSGDFDPKLYQYGGLWIYPLGGLLKIASLCGLVTLRPDLSYYLDRPEEFARFYIVARLYSAAWALIGVWAVFWIVHQLTNGSRTAATFAAFAYLAMPVVINMAHEAKPHMPAAVLMLLAVLAAIRYVDRGKLRCWLITSCFCGAAFGMVLSALPIFVVLPTMMLLRKKSWKDWFIKTFLGGLIGLVVYCLTNPYVLINLWVNREVLRSNFGNSLAMYQISRWSEGLVNAARLIGEGASPTLAIVGLLAAAVWGSKCIWALIVGSTTNTQGTKDRKRGAGWVLAAPVLLILVQFICLAAGKPGEYGRFAVLPDIALGISAVMGLYQAIGHMQWRRLCLFILVLLTACPGSDYLRAFIADSRAETPRLVAARQLEQLKSQGARSIAVFAEPAPYIMPPVDLFEQNILLLPPTTHIQEGILPADVVVGVREVIESHITLRAFEYIVEPQVSTTCNSEPTPISWANKTFVIVTNRQPNSKTQENIDHVPDHQP